MAEGGPPARAWSLAAWLGGQVACAATGFPFCPKYISALSPACPAAPGRGLMLGRGRNVVPVRMGTGLHTEPAGGQREMAELQELTWRSRLFSGGPHTSGAVFTRLFSEAPLC